MTAEELKALRVGAGVTQKELAKAIGVTETFIGMMERGERPIRKVTEMAVSLFITYRQVGV